MLTPDGFLGRTKITPDAYLMAYVANNKQAERVLNLHPTTSRRFRDFCLRRLQEQGTTLEDFIKRDDVQKYLNPFQPTEQKFGKGFPKRYVVSGVLANSEIDNLFLSSLKHYCAENNATLLLTPIRYKNISLFDVNTANWYPAEVHEDMVSGAVFLNDNLSIVDAAIQATASNPLSRIYGIAHGQSCIVPHTTLCMETVAAPQNETPGLRVTSMTISEASYSDTQAGKIARSNHVKGAIVVEIESESVFHIRYIQMDDTPENYGAFQEFHHASKSFASYHPNGDIVPNKRLSAIAYGDIHHRFLDKKVETGTWGKSGLSTIGKPENHILHDVFDMNSRSHHHEGKPYVNYIKSKTGDICVSKELGDLVAFIDSSRFKNGSIKLVQSNHHDHLSQWLQRSPDYLNLKLYHSLNLDVIIALEEGRDADPLFLHLSKNSKRKIENLSRNKGFYLKGVDFAQHGDVGVNGTKDSKSLLNTLRTIVIGHKHTPSIHYGRLWVSGTSSIKNMAYARGYSGWIHTHTIQYENGKLGQINIVEGKWFA